MEVARGACELLTYRAVLDPMWIPHAAMLAEVLNIFSGPVSDPDFRSSSVFNPYSILVKS